jgi:hypothetical protein
MFKKFRNYLILKFSIKQLKRLFKLLKVNVLEINNKEIPNLSKSKCKINKIVIYELKYFIFIF